MPKVFSIRTGNNSDSLKDFKELLLKQHKTSLIIQIDSYIRNLERYGFKINQEFKRDALKKLDKELYELRIKEARLFLYFDGDNFFIILHGFLKQSQETPIKEKKRAMEEIKRWKKENLI